MANMIDGLKTASSSEIGLDICLKCHGPTILLDGGRFQSCPKCVWVERRETLNEPEFDDVARSEVFNLRGCPDSHVGFNQGWQVGHAYQTGVTYVRICEKVINIRGVGVETDSRLPFEKQGKIFESLFNGNSGRKTARIAGVSVLTAWRFRRIAESHFKLKCKCGQPIGKKHWCKYVVESSPRRQHYLNGQRAKRIQTLQRKTAELKQSYIYVPNPRLHPVLK